MKNKLLLTGIVSVVIIFNAMLNSQHVQAATTTITVNVDKPTHAVSPMLFGLFFEDINLSADGGLYPELVRNRSFEDADTLQNWSFTCSDGKSAAEVLTADVNARPPLPPLNPFNRKFLCIKSGGEFKLRNDGYWGMNIVQGATYQLKFAARVMDGFEGALTIRLIGVNGSEIGTTVIKGFSNDWNYSTATLTATASDPKARLEISGKGVGRLFLDMVTLVPEKTWKNHGLRTDLAEAIDALKPRFLRFPGGCWVEGEDFEHMNHWKKTIGNIDSRTPLWNIWGYNATHGLGFHEYLQLAEDLGAEPLYCINAGISHKEVVPLDQMGQWIQDALDALEYANGTVTSVWGSIRAKNGHAAPFNLKYLEIGNENGMEPYAERWKLIADAVHAKYPEVQLIANEWAGGHPSTPKPGIIDEHYYNNPEWFIWNANHYDSYDRKGPKIFIGEYAVTSNTGNGNLRGAIGEAAWMTGMERNSDIVVMGSYAPLFCNANHKAWPVNLINYDSNRWFGLPSYYVQKLFAENQGTEVLPVKIANAPSIQAPYSNGCIGLGTWNNAAEFKELKVVTPSGKLLYQNNFAKNIDDWKKIGQGDWTVKDGILKQSAIAQNVTAFVGDVNWTDYTITLKARKLSGENGFQIYFHNGNVSQRLRWDLGGYGNSVHQMEIGVISKSIPATIESGRWYDVRIEIKGTSVKGYLDGKLVQAVLDSSENVSSLAVSAVHDDRSGDLILKVVNAHSAAVTARIDLISASPLSGSGTAIVLTSPSALDENTLEEPTKVSPKTEKLMLKGNVLKRQFPANSMTVLRVNSVAK